LHLNERQARGGDHERLIFRYLKQAFFNANKREMRFFHAAQVLSNSARVDTLLPEEELSLSGGIMDFCSCAREDEAFSMLLQEESK